MSARALIGLLVAVTLWGALPVLGTQPVPALAQGGGTTGVTGGTTSGTTGGITGGTTGGANTPAPGEGVTRIGIITNGIKECNFVTGRFGAACIPAFLAYLVTLIYAVVGIFFVLNIMLAGYQIAVKGAGLSDESAGKERLKWSIIGFAITVCSFLIIDFALTVLLA